MKSRKRKESLSEDKHNNFLPGTLEFLSEDVQEELMTLTDLSILLENERTRLDDIANESNHKVPQDEVRLTYALLRVLCDRFAGLAKKVDAAASRFREVLNENDLFPSRAGTWARSDHGPTTRILSKRNSRQHRKSRLIETPETA